MDMYSVVKENPILAILRNIPLEYTVDYAQAIVDGGISFFEVALNSEHGLKQIAILRDRFGEKCMIGAGTAISVDLAKAAIGAGAQFLLTPGTPIDVLQYCAKKDIMLLPGVFTPGDVATSLEFGYKTMKLFPAGCTPKGYLKALKGPYDTGQEATERGRHAHMRAVRRARRGLCGIHDDRSGIHMMRRIILQLVV